MEEGKWRKTYFKTGHYGEVSKIFNEYDWKGSSLGKAVDEDVCQILREREREMMKVQGKLYQYRCKIRNGLVHHKFRGPENERQYGSV